MSERTYVCIDLKSFYASVECVERKLDPMTANLVVADAARTEKTICLAVSPALKAYGIPGRARLFEVVEKVRDINAQRRQQAPHHRFTGESFDADALRASPELAVSYITAVPRMALYMEYSARIYDVYLQFIAPEDIHVYSIDEVFMDVTEYFHAYRLNAKELVQKMIHAVYAATGITATAGIGTNLYLAKVAMDIVAKHAKPDAEGARIAELDEASYRRQLWGHRPLTDFWRVGRGYAKKLEGSGIRTMGDVARCSVGKPTDFYNEELLYKMFGINAELLIDHAWGWEPCTMRQIKAYRPSTNSISSGQVLSYPYSYEKAKLIVREMAEMLSLDLVDRGLVAGQVSLTIGYDVENLKNPDIRNSYAGEIKTDHYGRSVPKHSAGTNKLDRPTASTKAIVDSIMTLYEQIVNQKLLIRRVTLVANNVVDAGTVSHTPAYEQLDLFSDYAAAQQSRAEEEAALEREKRMQQAMLSIKKKFGKNAILKGADLKDGATAVERNAQIGGHKA